MEGFRVHSSRGDASPVRASMRWVGSLVVGTFSILGGAIVQAQAPQTSLPECQPPRAEEYLLLVPNLQSNTQAQLQQLLPANAILTNCNYLTTNVVRVEGFASAEIAAAWAQYLQDSAGLQAYVSRPASAGSTAANPNTNPSANPNGVGGTSSSVPSPAPSSPVPSPAASPASPTPNPTASSTPSPAPSSAPPSSAPPSPAPLGPAPSPASPTPSPVTLAYNPQPLGAGFAVVVNFFNNPELVNSVRQVTARDVGLVAFEQEPYLLATYTTDAAVASALLKTLSERGLTAAIVDSRRTMVLSPAVRSD